MDSQYQKIRDTQKEAWNKSSPGWKKWDNMMMDFLKPVGEEMINMLNIKDDAIVMDVATGTGEPELTIASMLRNGKVLGTDLAQEMLAIAIKNAVKRDIKNFETICCDVSDLPFEDDSFDVITCRHGFMFFPDMELSLKEMMRVLRPGGRIAASAWSLSKNNFWICASMEIMIDMLQLTPPAPGAPGLFRCAEPNFMADLFKRAGVKNINETEVSGILPCETFETYWTFITEVASPVAFSKADDTVKHKINEKVMEKVIQKYPHGDIEMGSSAIVVCGEK